MMLEADTSDQLIDFRGSYLANPITQLEGVTGIRFSQCYVYTCGETIPETLYYHRREFYQLVFMTVGTGVLRYASHRLPVVGPALLLMNPLVPFVWENGPCASSASYCAFNEAFWQGDKRVTSPVLGKLPLFQPGNNPVVALNQAQAATFKHLFEDLRREVATSNTLHKDEILRNYVQLVLYKASEIASTTPSTSLDAASRITAQFLERLEQQFPLGAPSQVLRLRTPQDYADALAIHVNHLNRAVRATSGQTTTVLLAHRLVREASIILQYSTWTVAEISYRLGFAYPTYFNSFFRKHTGQTPLKWRQAMARRA